MSISSLSKSLKQFWLWFDKDNDVDLLALATVGSIPADKRTVLTEDQISTIVSSYQQEGIIFLHRNQHALKKLGHAYDHHDDIAVSQESMDPLQVSFLKYHVGDRDDSKMVTKRFAKGRRSIAVDLSKDFALNKAKLQDVTETCLRLTIGNVLRDCFTQLAHDDNEVMTAPSGLQSE